MNLKRMFAVSVFLVCVLVGMYWYAVHIDYAWALLLPIAVGVAFFGMWMIWMIGEREADVVTLAEFNEERRELALARKRRKG